MVGRKYTTIVTSSKKVSKSVYLYFAPESRNVTMVQIINYQQT